MCISSYDINQDGVPELVTGWSSGKVDVKHPDTGQILYKTSFNSHIAGIVKVRKEQGHVYIMYVYVLLSGVWKH